MRRTCILLGIPAVLAFQPTPSNVANLMNRSNFVFVGTVTKLKATTEPLVQASSSTAVVRVDDLITGENMAADMKGKEITVQLLKANSVSAGRSMLFFSSVTVAGKSLAVREIAHYDAPRNSKLAAQAADNAKSKPDADLQNRIRQAVLVVTGRVSSTKHLENRSPLGSEHDPEWTEAIVEVSSTEKGAPQERVSVWFAASDDIRWFRSPKFQAGQTGVFLLQRAQDKRIQGFTALDPLDFQPAEQRDRIRQAIARLR